MTRVPLWLLVVALAVQLPAAPAPVTLPGSALAQRPWFETRTAHFNIYSCGNPQDVFRLAGRLEQFCEAYTLLAGANAVASPPIVVMAFPDATSFRPFVPLYKGQPGSLAGFFKRGRDENLIAMALPGTNSAFTEMEVIFHEYAHLLFRRNAQIWPLWLTEGMAEVYSTFETAGYTVRIGRAIEPHVQILTHQPMLPLRTLFAVNHESPEYKERERQGTFYAESWLLTHYLMAGGTAGYQARFGQFTKLLREGQVPEQAFTNALQTSLAAMETELRRYLERGRFEPIQWALPMDLSSAKRVSTRALTPVEVYFWLGNELFRIRRFDEAGAYFQKAKELAPASPLPYEGLGLIAAECNDHAAALREMKDALRCGSTNYLAHYIHAEEKYRLTADAQNRYTELPKPQAAEIRALLRKTIALMPNFGPAHQLLGFFEAVQNEDLVSAERHLRRAIELEPENPSYLISLAQLQMRKHDLTAVRQTLAPLLLPGAEPGLRAHAEEVIREAQQDAKRR